MTERERAVGESPWQRTCEKQPASFGENPNGLNSDGVRPLKREAFIKRKPTRVRLRGRAEAEVVTR